MAFVEDGVTVKEISATRWKLLTTLVYKGQEQTFTVPEGFLTDFASVPKIFMWLVPPHGLYTKAAVLHDFLCDTKPVNRSDADGIFRRAMRELGVSFLRRWIMWAAVRAGSKLQSASMREVCIWLLVALPTLAFLAIPGIIVLAWLSMFWIIEYVLFASIKPFRRHKRVNKPSFLLGADSLDTAKNNTLAPAE